MTTTMVGTAQTPRLRFFDVMRLILYEPKEKIYRHAPRIHQLDSRTGQVPERLCLRWLRFETNEGASYREDRDRMNRVWSLVKFRSAPRHRGHMPRMDYKVKSAANGPWAHDVNGAWILTPRQ